MNRDLYRLKFSRKLGYRVPVAEHVRGNPTGGRRLRRPAVLAMAGALAAIGMALPALASPALPVPAAAFVAPNSPGNASTPVVSGSTMTINTHAPTVVLQYQSFNIGAGHAVHINQPSSASRAINRVLPGGPRSDIHGALQSNGQVFLINQAGVLFGPGARVDVAGLVASSLKMSDELIERGLSALGAASPAFARDGEAGDVVVQAGARIVAAQGGRILLAAPNISNAGELINTEGQTILAAGEKLYLADPLDSRLRGFLVEVDNGGQVSNEDTGRLLSSRGNITMVGNSIRHAGEARATTAVTLNGTIFLKARDTVVGKDADRMFPDIEPIDTDTEAPIPVGTNTGTVVLAAGSVLEIQPETGSTQTIRDDAAFRPSEINVYGRRIIAEDADDGAAGAQILAPAGMVRLTATTDDGSNNRETRDSDGQVYLGKGAVIDVSGLEGVKVAADHDIIEVELRGDELKDSPVLRDPAYGRALVGKKIQVDSVQGTRLADISAYFGSIERTVAERSTKGGTVAIFSQGEVIADRSSRIDVSGGSVDYLAGKVTRSVLTSEAGARFFVEDAPGDRPYKGQVIDRTVRVAARTEGRDAGKVGVTAFGAALDGAIAGSRTVGVGQQVPRTRNTGPRSSEVIGAPVAGTLSIDLLTQAGEAPQQTARFVNSVVERSLFAGMSLTEPLLMSSSWFEVGGLGDFRLAGAATVSLPAGVVLKLPPTARRNDAGVWVDGANFSVSGARIALDGDILAPGATLAFRTLDPLGTSIDPAAHAITVGAGARLSTAGRWINEATDGVGGYLAHDGGSIGLVAAGSLVLAADSLLDVSAGAWMTSGRTVVLGEAGRLNLVSGTIPGATMTLGGRLAGYGVRYGQSVSDGGTLGIETRRLRLDEHDGNDGQVLVLGTERLGADGFSHFALTGRDGLEVGVDGRALVVRPEPLARALAGRLIPRGGAADLSWASAEATERALRGPTSLVLRATSLTDGVLSVGEQARIEVDAGGRIALTGNAGVNLAGTLIAPGGEIEVAMSEPSFGEDYVGSSIRISGSARIDASGVLLSQMIGGRLEGMVFDGGSISIDARRGYLVAEAGAVIRSDGTQGTLDLPAAGSGRMALTTLASDGGAIRLSAREGLYSDATLSAAAGGSGAHGGSLALALDHGSTEWNNVLGLPLAVRSALLGLRTLEVFANSTGNAVHFGSGAPDDARFGGRAEIGAAAIADGGFLDLSLQAVGRSNSNAVLRFGEDVALNLAGMLVLDTPNIIGANGASARLHASALVWTNARSSAQGLPLPPVTQAGDGSLTLSAGQMDVVGNVAASGFSRVAVDAVHDLRLTGAVYDVDPDVAQTDIRVRGSLVSAGDISVRAAQIYPTTMSEFALEIHNNPGATLSTHWSGESASTPLSAAGMLTLAAPRIVHGGVLRAPFGKLNFVAEEISRAGQYDSAVRAPAAGGEVHLLDGSVASVSADDRLIPFGATRVSGREWIYALGGGSLDVIDALPERSVTLSGTTLISDEGAVVDISGGGNLLAWEWIPGLGGSTDILAGDGEHFAIMPTAGLYGTPFDQGVAGADGGGVGNGLITVLNGGNGLEAGTYVLLPARYALLPGTFLVSLKRELADLPSIRARVQADGSVLLAAQDARLVGDAVQVSGRRFGIEVLTAEQVLTRAEYLLSRASDFFDGSSDDAGRLSLQVGSSLDFRGQLLALAAGRGPQVDLTATQLAVLGEGALARAGEVGVSVDLINRFGADSLMLGAVRGELNADGERRVSTDNGVFGARTVRVANATGAALSAAEIIVQARDEVRIESGSRLVAAGDSVPEVLRIEGSGVAADGAMLRVSGADADAARRDAPSRAGGDLVLEDGAVIRGHSVVLDGTRETVNQGADFELSAGGLMTLTGSRVSVGETAGVSDGLVFSNAQLAGLGSPSRLRLKSYTTLDLYGAVSLGNETLDSLIVDAAAVVGRDNAGLTQQITARELTFTNSNEAAPDAAVFAGVGSSGALQVNAANLILGATPDALGDESGFSIRGYQEVALHGSESVLLSDRGNFALAGDVSVHTPVLLAATGARQAVSVDGDLVMRSSAAADPAQVAARIAAAGLGAKVELTAQSMLLDTKVVLPAGHLIATAEGSDAADGSLVVGANGVVEARGVSRDMLGALVSVPAGTVELASVHGDVSLLAGSRVDVSGEGDGDAGTVRLLAPEGSVNVANGTLHARPGSQGGVGGALQVDVRQLGLLDAFAAMTTDFTRRWALRVRESDTRLSAAGGIRSNAIAISADAGSVVVEGSLDASGAKGGSISLGARRDAAWAGSGEGAGDVVLGAVAVLDARATEHLDDAFGTRGEGGTVVLDASPRAAGGTELAPQGGRIRIADGAQIEVGTAAADDGSPSAAREGLVTLRAERLGGVGLGIDALPAGAISGARAIHVEGTAVRETATLDMAVAHTANNTFMAAGNLAALRSTLGIPDGDTRWHVRPHVEYRSSGNFTIGADENLNLRRYVSNLEAGSLTVRAAGDLIVNESLSDGFSTATTAGLLQSRDSGWNIALIAGADLGAAAAGSTRALTVLDAADTGDIRLAANKFVRSGGGSIDVVAGRDVRFGSGASIYSAGVADVPGDVAFTNATRVSGGSPASRAAEYPSSGGDVSIRAGGSIVAAQSSQLISQWLYRQGSVDADGNILAASATQLRNPTWYPRFDQFAHGVATFGGGDVDVAAAGDILNLGVAAATNGRLFGAPGTLPDMSDLKVQGGGDVTIRAGGDIGSPVLYAGRGQIEVDAGGEVGNSRTNSPLAAVIALGEASARVRAAGDVVVQGITSATLLRQVAPGGSVLTDTSRQSYFSTLAPDSAVEVMSFGGSVELLNANPQNVGNVSLFMNQPLLAPSSLSLIALGGDVDIMNSMVMLPSERNSLLLAARDSVVFSALVKIADTAVASVPSVLKPAINDADPRWRALGSRSASGRTAHDEALASTRVVDAVRVVAERGNVTGPAPGTTLEATLLSPQPVWVKAAGDVRDFAVRAQHLGDDDITRIEAGGDIVFSPALSNSVLLPQNEGFVVGGPGRVELIAGGDIDLANSFGIVTRGNFDNPYLAEKGASIYVHAGAGTLDYAALVDRLRLSTLSGADLFDSRMLTSTESSDLERLLELNPSLAELRSGERANISSRMRDYDSAVTTWMRSRTGEPSMTDGAARAAFERLPATEMDTFFAANRPLLQALLNAGLRYSGRLGDRLKDGTDGYEPGYALLAAVFPTVGEGSLNVFYSQIRSEQDGGIELLAPGGSITVGVTGAGASTIPASRQGIFAVGSGEINAIVGDNFEVGPSRVFTLGGDDIQIWSSRGNVDAGKGAKTAASTPPPQVRIRGDLVVLDISDSVTGSGIGTLRKNAETPDADVRMYAPAGEVNAGDAGIRSTGTVEIGAQQIVGADNIAAAAGLSSSVAPPPPPAPPPTAASTSDPAAAGGDMQAQDGAMTGQEPSSLLSVEILALGDGSDPGSPAPEAAGNEGEEKEEERRRGRRGG